MDIKKLIDESGRDIKITKKQEKTINSILTSQNWNVFFAMENHYWKNDKGFIYNFVIKGCGKQMKFRINNNGEYLLNVIGVFIRELAKANISINMGDIHICDRCFGKGVLPHYSHVDDGVCFKCNGAGVVM
jgi:DnaJ-class molecular chaperone